uniref:Protein MIZU-KUSSEI 1 n=1 Tax=Davidia involucrata TaxID=16924 RepID=A0A5B6YPV6_DAVIN
MKTIMAKSSQDFYSKRHFHWTKKVSNEDEEAPTTFKSSSTSEDEKKEDDKVVAPPPPDPAASSPSPRKKLQAIAVSRLRSVLTVFGRNRSQFPLGLGPRVVGTLFGHRRGHVHFVFQRDPASPPAFLIELATPISGLVREMASGLVRIALECDKEEEKKASRLLEEPLWRTYCNGKKCGFATRRECGPKEWKVLKAVEPISMGAGVLPGDGDGDESEGEIMYMRAKFERVVGSRDSEAFYMMNPDSNGAPELSIYLLRV